MIKGRYVATLIIDLCIPDDARNLIALNGFTVRCSNNDCIGSTIEATYNRQGDAIEAWNRRPEDVTHWFVENRSN